MDYETGSATDAHDMLDKIRTFLVANGWTQNGYVSETYGYRLHLNKGALYINMFSGIATDPISGKYMVFDHLPDERHRGFTVPRGSTASPTGAKAWKNMPGAPVHDPSYFDYADDIFACAVADMTGAVSQLPPGGRRRPVHCGHGDFNGCLSLDRLRIARRLRQHRIPTQRVLREHQFVHGWIQLERPRVTKNCAAFSPTCVLPTHHIQTPTLRFNDGWAVPGGNPVGDVAQPISAIGYGYTPYQDTSITWGAMHGLLSSMPADIGGLSPLLPAQIGVVYSGNPVPIGHFGLARIAHMDGFSVGQSISVGSEDFVVLPCNNADFDYPYAIAIKVTGA